MEENDRCEIMGKDGIGIGRTKLGPKPPVRVNL